MNRLIILFLLVLCLSSCATESYQLVNFPTRHKITTQVDSVSVEEYQDGVRKWIHTPIGKFAYEGNYSIGEEVNSYVKPFMMKVK